ncbi:hypothetical protein TNCV_1415931 [Trichonephila clavipes]|nr:hypothetical protein TNCV_1415931 [Trichonephila clavipes]
MSLSAMFGAVHTISSTAMNSSHNTIGYSKAAGIFRIWFNPRWEIFSYSNIRSRPTELIAARGRTFTPVSLFLALSTIQVTIGIAFQTSITDEVSACSGDGRFSWLRNLRSNSSLRCSMGFRSRRSEKASPVFKHPFRQNTSVQASMCGWSSYSAGREMGLP